MQTDLFFLLSLACAAACMHMPRVFDHLMESGGGDGSTAALAAADKGEGNKEEELLLVPQLRFPMGFRFVPSEVELVDVYLRAKIEGRELPLSVVNEVKILEWTPGKLVEKYRGYGENRWYFFTVREDSSSNKPMEPNRKLRVAGVTASWKATGRVAHIRRSPTGEVVGTKRILIYHTSDAGEDGDWSMHEYILADRPQMDQYVLCTIQRKLHSDTKLKAAAAAAGGSKRKRGTGTGMEQPKKKTATPPAQQEAACHQQQQQEATSNGPAVPPPPPPPPPLMQELQDHQALHGEHGHQLALAPPDETILASAAAVQHGWPDLGDHDHQLDDFAQMFAEYDAHYAPNLFQDCSGMVPVHTQDPLTFYNQEEEQQQQQLLGYTDQFMVSPITDQFLHQNQNEDQFMMLSPIASQFRHQDQNGDQFMLSSTANQCHHQDQNGGDQFMVSPITNLFHHQDQNGGDQFMVSPITNQFHHQDQNGGDQFMVSPIANQFVHQDQNESVFPELEPLITYPGPAPLGNADLYNGHDTAFDATPALAQLQTDDFFDFTGVHGDHGVDGHLGTGGRVISVLNSRA